jgi:hypothetical protein
MLCSIRRILTPLLAFLVFVVEAVETSSVQIIKGNDIDERHFKVINHHVPEDLLENIFFPHPVAAAVTTTGPHPVAAAVTTTGIGTTRVKQRLVIDAHFDRQAVVKFTKNL